MLPFCGMKLSGRDYGEKSHPGCFATAQFAVNTWILYESEAFMCKALKGKAIVAYAEPLITQQMKASGSPVG